jgi:hypothetical protein
MNFLNNFLKNLKNFTKMFMANNYCTNTFSEFFFILWKCKKKLYETVYFPGSGARVTFKNFWEKVLKK